MRSIRLFFQILIFAWVLALPAQQQGEGATRINIEHADVMEGSERFGKNVQALFGNVRFRHHQTIMNCDSAFFYRDSNLVRAHGNIHIIHNDSIHLHGNVLYYDGNQSKAMIRGNVRLINGDVLLTTEYMDYDRINDVAFYFNGGRVTSGDTQLDSSWGLYFPRTGEAHFRDSVVVTSPQHVMTSDTLIYLTIPEVVKIVGPTTIKSERNVIFSEEGYYDTLNEFAKLTRNNSISGDGRVLKGDTILYNRVTGRGEVFSNMMLLDTANHIFITGNHGYYNELTEKAFATRQAVLKQVNQGDTLFLHADTLRVDPVPESEFQLIRAFRNVKFFSQDFQGRSDSMVYCTRDSINSFYGSPVIWALKNQMSANTIHLHTRNRALYRAVLDENSFVIAPEDSISFNQIKGRDMVGHINANQLHRIDVDGNGQAIYFPKEDDVIVGLNRAEASSMSIILENHEVTGIILRSQAAGAMNPPLLVNREARFLEGFRWLEEFRPKKKEDIFVRDIPPRAAEQLDYSEFVFDIALP